MEQEQKYKVVKIGRKSGRREIIEKNLTAEEAQRVVARFPNSTRSMVIYTKMGKGSKIKAYRYERGDKVDFNKLSKDQLNSDYPFKDSKWIWDNWTKDQRYHFIYDHSNEFIDILEKKSMNELSETIYSKLPEEVKTEIVNHIGQGRYENGDKISGQKNYEYYFEEAKGFDNISDINISPNYVEITPYSPTDVYYPKIRFTKSELMSMAIKSFIAEGHDEESIKGMVSFLLKN